MLGLSTSLSGPWQDWVTNWLGLIVEALPFLLLGAFIAAILVSVKRAHWLLAKLPRHGIWAYPSAILIGMALPVCECGNVPVLRKLIAQGLPLGSAISFFLAAPILNPITISTTALAFGDQPFIIIGRVIGAAAIAVIAGMIFNRSNNETVLQTDFLHEIDEHHHDDFMSTLLQEFFTMLQAMVVGAAIAATTQIIIPRSIIVMFAANPVLAIAVMMLLAFIVSICANVDAFFALAYAGIFPPGAIVAFLVFGPMIDIKLLLMLQTTIKRSWLVRMTLIVGIGAFIAGLIINIITAL